MVREYLPYIVTETFCIAFALDIYFRLHPKLDPEHGQNDLRKMILAYIVMLATDIFGACVEDGFTRPAHYLSAVVNAASVIAVALGCYYWYQFVEDRLDAPKSRCRLLTRRALTLPILAICALNLLSIFTGWVFYIDPVGKYEEGRLFWVQGVVTYAYLLVPTAHSLVCAARTEQPKKKKEYLSYASYIVIPVLLNSLIPDLPVPLFALSIFLVIQMLFLTLYLDQEYALAKKERELSESRTAVMLSQIQPHFLYNTLTAIQSMCQDKAPEAAQTTVEFAEFLRGNLDSLTRKEPVPFAKELRHTQTYLALEQKRYGERLRVEYDLQTDGFLLPALTLQPIAENAVQHGVAEREDGGTVRISTAETPRAFTITVSDDGVGFDTAAKPRDGRSHVGIANVRERLAVLCGGTLTVESVPGEGTTALISIPKEARSL